MIKQKTKNTDLIIVKIGGSVITHKNSQTPKINNSMIEQVCKEISQIVNNRPDLSIILIHGAGSYGHPIVKKTKINKGIKTEKQLVDFGRTQILQNELNCIFCSKLIDFHIPAIPCQASSHSIMNHTLLQKMNVDVVEGLLSIGMMPVLYGVPAYDKNQGCSILSGDDIAVYLGKKFVTKFNSVEILFGTNVDGVYSKDPKQYGDCEFFDCIKSNNCEQVLENLSLEKSKTDFTVNDVTGKMYGKVKKSICAANTGVRVRIFDVSKRRNLQKIISGNIVGTLIK